MDGMTPTTRTIKQILTPLRDTRPSLVSVMRHAIRACPPTETDDPAQVSQGLDAEGSRGTARGRRRAMELLQWRFP
jgi:hypothetical protein